MFCNLDAKTKIEEKYLLENFHKIQKYIQQWENKYPLPQDLIPMEPVESEDRKPYIIQPFYTYQIHATN